MSPSMQKRNTGFVVCGALLGMTLFLSCGVEAEQTRTITIPADTKVVEVESSYCEPIMQGDTLYVPRCWRLKQGPAAPNMIERLVSRAGNDAATTVENQLGNAIDYQAWKLGQSMQDWLRSGQQ